MRIEKGHLVRINAVDGNTYTGTIYGISIEQCEDDDNKPHVLVSVSQDRRFADKEGNFGCLSIWLEGIESIRKLEGTGCNQVTTSLRAIHDEAEKLLKDIESNKLLEGKNTWRPMQLKCGETVMVNF